MSILGPSGRNYVMIGGAHAWRVHHLANNVTVLFQWLDLRGHMPDAPQDPHPCMVLVPTEAREHFEPYVIPQIQAYAYADPNGGPTPDLQIHAYSAAEALGFDMRDRSSAMKIVDIILNYVPDLIEMPSDAPEALQPKRTNFGITMRAHVPGVLDREEVI